MYHSDCFDDIWDGDIHFKGRFDPSVAGLWYELFDYNSTDQVDIIDYQYVTYNVNTTKTQVESQTLIRYSCFSSADGLFWTLEVWSRRSDVPKSVVMEMMEKFPNPIDSSKIDMNDQSKCSFDKY